jgi:LytS/YehU family sensor histidine kinase
VRQILDFSSQPLIALSEELDLLHLYLELEQLRFENRFLFEIDIDPQVSLKESYIPPLLLNPIVENAIWHGLLPIQNDRQGRLVIAVKRESDDLCISIEDNGVGRAEKAMSTPYNNNKSYGIKITEQQLSNINYLYKSKEASIKYIDLKNIDETPAGTLVVIRLPIDLKFDYSGED